MDSVIVGGAWNGGGTPHDGGFGGYCGCPVDDGVWVGGAAVVDDDVGTFVGVGEDIFEVAVCIGSD